MDRRKERRIKRRMSCELFADGRRYRGFVRDVSPRGLFVQMQTAPPFGTEVDVRLRIEREPAIDLRALVRRERRVPSRLASVAPAGIGLRITTAPALYYELLKRFTAAPPPNASRGRRGGVAQPDGRSYRVRIKQVGGPRSRTIVVGGTSSEEAAERARSEAGPGWDVLTTEAV